jgi:hypothetical protein
MRNILIPCLLLLSLVFVSSAEATTLVAGDLRDNQSGGVWAQHSNMFYLFYDINNTNGVDRIPIKSFSAISSILVGASRPTHIVLGGMGTGNRGTSALTVADFSLYNGSTLLLSATLGNNDGTLSYTNRLGLAGNFDFLSDLTVNGGSLFTAGLVEGIINVAVNGNNGYYARPKDFLFQDISFSVSYTPSSNPPNPNPIPEPATSALLVSSLVGVVAKRRKKFNKI